jgi:hypothetical protein
MIRDAFAKKHALYRPFQFLIASSTAHCKSLIHMLSILTSSALRLPSPLSLPAPQHDCQSDAPRAYFTTTHAAAAWFLRISCVAMSTGSIAHPLAALLTIFSDTSDE